MSASDTCTFKLMHTLVLTQEACGKAWVLYDVAILTAMLICVTTYSIYIQSLADFQPHDEYPVYDSLGGAQARLLLPKKQEKSTYNGETSSFIPEFHMNPVTRQLARSAQGQCARSMQRV